MVLFPADHPSWPAPAKKVRYLFGLADREHILEQVYEGSDYHHRMGQLLALHFDGLRFRQVKLQEAADLAWIYTRQISAAWKRL